MNTNIKANFFKYKKNMGVVEVFIESEFSLIKNKLSIFSIEDKKLKESDWQVPYMEQYFSANRAEKLCETYEEPTDETQDFNIVFFMYELTAGQILRTPFGKVIVNELQTLPQEYKEILEFEPMD